MVSINPAFQKELSKAVQFNYLTDAPSDDTRNRTTKVLGRYAAGVLAGGALSYLSTVSGLSVGLHEVVGHGLLGFRLTHSYPQGKGPTYQVDGWDNLQAIGKAENAADGFKAFGDWITGKDTHGDGFAGWASLGEGTPNALGKAMGPDGLSAWISITGSLPGLLLNTLSVAGGMKVKDSSPALGAALVTFGLSEHLMSSAYTWSAAAMSNAELQANAMTGHDFANFAVRIGNMTGTSAKAVAVSTACVWTAFVPLVAIAMYFHTKSRQTDIVPERLGLQNWLSKVVTDEKVKAKLEKLLKKYPRRNELENLWKIMLHRRDSNNAKKFAREYPLEMRRFAEYLLDTLPRKTIRKEKRAVLKKWQKLQKPDKTQKVLSGLSIFGMIVSIATKIFQILGQTIVKALAPVATALTYATPLFVGISVISSGYETYKDLKSSSKNVPKKAKVLSVVKLIVAIATAIGIVVGTMASGLVSLLIASVVVSIVGALALSYARQKVIEKRFRFLQTLEPAEWLFSMDLLKVYEEDKNSLPVKKAKKIRKKLTKWIKKQRQAKKKGWLEDAQWQELSQTELFKAKAKK